jgi:hypothetical protein
MGTANNLSLRTSPGLDVDARTDIWSLGASSLRDGDRPCPIRRSDTDRRALVDSTETASANDALRHRRTEELERIVYQVVGEGSR